MSESSISRPAVREAARSEALPLVGRISHRRRNDIIRQILIQLFLLFMLAVVIFPALWIVSMAIDPRGITRPTDLNLIPANANLDAFTELLTEPFTNVLPVYFGQMLMNSLFVALGTALATVTLGASAAYAFSRFKFIGRQAGMLGFILLLMLPTTGTLIPLYIIFSSVQMNSTLVAAVPSFFAGLLVAGFVFVVYQIVRGLLHPDPDAVIKIDRRIVVAGVAVLSLLTIMLTFYVLFERSTVYSQAIGGPLRDAKAPFVAAQEDYDRRVGSVSRTEGTAARRERQAVQYAADLETLTGINDQVAAASEADIAGVLETQIAGRDGLFEDAEDDLILQALLAAQSALETDGRDVAITALSDGLTALQAEAEEAQADALSSRQSAEEGSAELVTAEATLTDARTNFAESSVTLYGLRSNAFFAALPYMLLAWVAGLIGAVVVWGIVYGLRAVIEPATLLSVLLWSLLAAITIGLGLVALQGRLRPDMPPLQTLRATLMGLSLAFASSALPFAIWNLKGYFDTIPKELEEAALIDGAGLVGTFFRIMVPLAMPAFAITILFSFMQGWTEFILSWLFLTGNTGDYTLAMALATLTNGANEAPPDMQKFAAMSILISLPILLLFFGFQRWIVSGLSLGGVKG